MNFLKFYWLGFKINNFSSSVFKISSLSTIVQYVSSKINHFSSSIIQNHQITKNQTITSKTKIFKAINKHYPIFIIFLIITFMLTIHNVLSSKLSRRTINIKLTLKSRIFKTLIFIDHQRLLCLNLCFTSEHLVSRIRPQINALLKI